MIYKLKKCLLLGLLAYSGVAVSANLSTPSCNVDQVQTLDDALKVVPRGDSSLNISNWWTTLQYYKCSSLTGCSSPREHQRNDLRFKSIDSKNNIQRGPLFDSKLLVKFSRDQVGLYIETLLEVTWREINSFSNSVDSFEFQKTKIRTPQWSHSNKATSLYVMLGDHFILPYDVSENVQQPTQLSFALGKSSSGNACVILRGDFEQKSTTEFETRMITSFLAEGFL